MFFLIISQKALARLRTRFDEFLVLIGNTSGKYYEEVLLALLRLWLLALVERFSCGTRVFVPGDYITITTISQDCNMARKK